VKYHKENLDVCRSAVLTCEIIGAVREVFSSCSYFVQYEKNVGTGDVHEHFYFTPSFLKIDTVKAESPNLRRNVNYLYPYSSISLSCFGETFGNRSHLTRVDYLLALYKSGQRNFTFLMVVNELILKCVL
jgi:hypothetical protein